MDTAGVNKIVLIGSGNVATHMGMALKQAGKEILQLYSRTEIKAAKLAQKLNTSYTNNITHLTDDADLYIISVADDAIAELVDHILLKNSLIVHTSGAEPLSVLQKKFANCGVFYPLQTFSIEKPISFGEIPVCIEANSKKNEILLRNLAGEISKNVYGINSEQRSILHVAAVFACNFTNHMYGIAQSILSDNHLSFDMLKPLIAETADKIKLHLPHQVQTGPAMRNDMKVMARHKEMLEKYPEFKKIYELISASIKAHK